MPEPEVETPSATAVADAPVAGDLDLGYQVAIDAFSGPLDLLLYLVRRAQVDITDIPIGEIADQFVATVGSWQDLDLDSAGDFILMAATLLEIKSRTVMPPVEGEPGEGEGDEEWFDPRSDLIRQLLAYRRFKDASGVLDACERAHAARCARQLHESIPEDPDEAETWSLDNADPYLLFRAWEGVLAKIAGLGPRTVIYDDVPMESRMAALTATMQATREARLSWLFESVPARIQRVGMLVAMLECVRQRIVEALQYEQYGEVFLRFRDEVERAIAAVLPPEEVVEAKRRRRRPPLVTWQAPAATTADGEEAELPDLVEEVVETDEQRFVRELNESCRVDAVLATVADIEASFTVFREQLALDRANAEKAAREQREQGEQETKADDVGSAVAGDRGDDAGTEAATDAPVPAAAAAAPDQVADAADAADATDGGKGRKRRRRERTAEATQGAGPAGDPAGAGADPGAALPTPEAVDLGPRFTPLPN